MIAVDPKTIEGIIAILVQLTALVVAVGAIVTTLRNGQKKQEAYNVVSTIAKNKALEATPNAEPVTIASPEVTSGTGDGSLDKEIDKLLIQAADPGKG